MATRHKPIPITDENIDQALSERAGVRRDAELERAHDSFGSYLTNCREGFVARFKQAQQALASRDASEIQQLGDEARRSEAEAIAATYPK